MSDQPGDRRRRQGDEGGWAGRPLYPPRSGRSERERPFAPTGPGQYRRDYLLGPEDDWEQAGTGFRPTSYGEYERDFAFNPDYAPGFPGRERGFEAEPGEGPYRGIGPRGYRRPDSRIEEDVCERLTLHGQIDASEIEVEVREGEVTLNGAVDSRRTKRLAEQVSAFVPGVVDVHNRLRLSR